MNENTTEYNNKRTDLQREIVAEQQKLIRVTSQPSRSHQSQVRRNTNTSKSDTNHSKLPFYYPRVQERTNEICDKKPYSMNIPDSSIFSAHYDVDSYLRRNLNFNKEKVFNRYEDNDSVTSEIIEPKKVVERALIHDRPEERLKIADRPKENVAETEPSYMKNVDNVDTLPIPVLRHSPKRQKEVVDDNKMSEAMKKVDDKWKVPAVQKNILKALPDEEGKSVNILTQLGSIRRQLQLEQLKLDRLISKDDDV